MLHQPPVDQWIVYECLQHSHEGLFVVTQDSHCDLASHAEAALNAANLGISGQLWSSQKGIFTYFHSVRQHARKPERYLLRELFAMHRNFEAVAKIDMYDLAGGSFEQYV